MHLAVLMTNTDESAFAAAHPKDGDKFAQMIQAVRPDWRVTSFDVKDGIFPVNPKAFDGVMITGSPASVHDGEAWIAQLERLIRDLYDAKTPMFGACFGHQAIAKALGGQVTQNPGGWVFGLAETDVVERPVWAKDLPGTLRQYAAHVEQVTVLPEGAAVLLRSDACPAAGFAIGTHVYTTQNHPEMTHDFIHALVEEYADKLDSNVVKTARKSLEQQAHTKAYAESIARFFEQAA
jgi:GMP synthase-like glutamine amidotransferase